MLIQYRYACLVAIAVWGMACHDVASQSSEREWPVHFGFGKTATAAQIDSLDIAIRPDGNGLPPGSGNAVSGKKIYLAKCALCHGETGAEPTPNRLVAPIGDTAHVKTIGNYWPYATTIFDYIRRAMPFNAPGSLSNDEVYHLTAFLLYRNQIIDSTLQLNAMNLPKIVMPAKKYYVDDDRRGGNEIK
ncbi:c-type cytochrome [Chitinophaga sp. 30R24]|uniref:c-type cytochrome n=1 Tax=Chitinophaga sp. 30R24 TaxID=3248838 RepID=UPI003B9155DB